MGGGGAGEVDAIRGRHAGELHAACPIFRLHPVSAPPCVSSVGRRRNDWTRESHESIGGMASWRPLLQPGWGKRVSGFTVPSRPVSSHLSSPAAVQWDTIRLLWIRRDTCSKRRH